MKTRVQMICKYCGSDQVLADAYVKWDIETQEWEVANIFEKGAVCEVCDGETRIVEKKIKP